MSSILSVGIDIGTSTTQLVFSRITVENMTDYFSVPKISIVEKEVVYKSRVYTTPLINLTRIDGAAVRDIVEKEYKDAGIAPKDVDTGAVIITGESARKENAADVLENLSGFAGDFVVSTAGPDLESIIAGKGSGAYQYSMDNHCITANLDIGGGTTNIVLFNDGDVIGKGCFDIGGRLIRLKDDYTVEYISPAASKISSAVGIDVSKGNKLYAKQIACITDKMADLLAQALFLKPQEPLLKEIQTPESSWLEKARRDISRICFSGGVADYINGDSEKDIPYGDIGVFLGRSIRNNEQLKSITQIKGTETIRATVVGAGTYTTSISGSTISYDSNLFPIKNIPALKLTQEEQEGCFKGNHKALKEKILWFMKQSETENIILALSGKGNPEYGELKVMAMCLSSALDSTLPKGAPAIIVLEHDIAKALGNFMKVYLRDKRPVICIDGIKVEQGDYVDMGKPIMNGLVIPVVVKTLLFG